LHEFQRGAIIEPGDRDFRSIAYRGNNQLAQRILIVDDDSSFRALVRALITNGHVKVVGEASDGEEAVRLVEKLTPDIVLMDVSMPKRDGVVAAEEIGERWPDVRVIFITGTNAGTTLRRLAGRDYIRKGSTDLGAAISAALTV